MTVQHHMNGSPAFAKACLVREQEGPAYVSYLPYGYGRSSYQTKRKAGIWVNYVRLSCTARGLNFHTLRTAYFDYSGMCRKKEVRARVCAGRLSCCTHSIVHVLHLWMRLNLTPFNYFLHL